MQLRALWVVWDASTKTVHCHSYIHTQHRFRSLPFPEGCIKTLGHSRRNWVRRVSWRRWPIWEQRWRRGGTGICFSLLLVWVGSRFWSITIESWFRCYSFIFGTNYASSRFKGILWLKYKRNIRLIMDSHKQEDDCKPTI